MSPLGPRTATVTRLWLAVPASAEMLGGSATTGTAVPATKGARTVVAAVEGTGDEEDAQGQGGAGGRGEATDDPRSPMTPRSGRGHVGAELGRMEPHPVERVRRRPARALGVLSLGHPTECTDGFSVRIVAPAPAGTRAEQARHPERGRPGTRSHGVPAGTSAGDRTEWVIYDIWRAPAACRA